MSYLYVNESLFCFLGTPILRVQTAPVLTPYPSIGANLKAIPKAIMVNIVKYCGRLYAAGLPWVGMHIKPF